MKKRSITKKLIMSLLMLPINICAIIVLIPIIIMIRALNRAKKLHVRLESLEKGNK